MISFLFGGEYMQNILYFINNNAIIASLITLSITLITQIIFRKSDRKYDEKKEIKKEKKQQFLNKAELHIEDIKWNSKEKTDICLFMTDFKVSLTDDKDVVFNYNNAALNKDEYKHLRFYFKNIGNADINQLDICVTNQKDTMLCDIESVKTIIENRVVNYSYCYDRKILKNDIISIDIAYLENSKTCNIFSSELVLLFKDSYGNLYEQLFFIQRSNLYEPHIISDKEYRLYTLPNTALECFKNPWLW